MSENSLLYLLNLNIQSQVKDTNFANALAKGWVRFAKFMEAKKIKTGAIRPAGLRKQVEMVLRQTL